MCCVKIEVKLTPEGSTLLGGIDWAVLDLAPNFTLNLSKKDGALTDENTFVVEGATSFSVPFSTVNDAALLPFDSPIIMDNNVDGLEARVQADSMVLPFDTIYFKRRDETTRTWELEFRVAVQHWADLATKKKLNTIDLGTLDYTLANVTGSWDRGKWEDTDPIYACPPADYGTWVDLSEPAQFTQPPVKSVWVEDCRPLLSVPHLLKKGFCEIGWNLEGLVLETELSRRLWTYILKRDFYTESRGGEHRLIGRGTNAFTFQSLVPLLSFNTLYFDPGSHAIPAGAGPYIGAYGNKMGYKTDFRLSLKGFAENSGGSPVTWSFRLMYCKPTDGFPLWQWATNEVLVTLTAGETRFVDISFELELEPNKAVSFWGTIGGKFKPGYLFEALPIQKTLVRGDTVTIKNLVHPEYTLMQLFKGYVHAINGKTSEDWNTKTLTVYPDRTTTVLGENVPGYVFDEADPIDITSRVVCNSIKMAPVRNNLGRYSRLSWADSTDPYITDQELEEPPYSRKILNGLELPDEVTELNNPFFEPTLERQSEELKQFGRRPFPFFPLMTDNTDGELSYEIGPRLLYGFGSIRQVNPAPIGNNDEHTGFYFEGAGISYFGYWTQKRTWNLDAITPPPDFALVYGTVPDDLYVLFWLGLSQRNKRGMLLDILVFIGPKEYSAWDFRTKFAFNFNGRPIVGRGFSLRDFSTCDQIPTPMQVLVEPVDTACCDLPCSCRFKQCTYYQDLSPYIAQDTLDELKVTSFVVEGVEQIATPVGLGLISVKQIAGRPYLTNLVDTLNALGIAYFTFGYSQKVFTPKEDLRYFTIKHPFCYSFTIIISDNGGEVYRYTEKEQKTQWFAPGWADFGYGGTFIGVPEDCLTTTEY